MKERSFTSRTRARKRAVDVLFEADQRGLSRYREDLLDLLDQRRTITAAQTPLPPYAIEVVEGVAEHLYDIDDLIATHSTNRDLDRLPAVDRAVLRVGVWEILWNEDVPSVTAIDEAVIIAKAVSADDSPARVNAILDAVRANREEVRAADEALEAAFRSFDRTDDSLPQAAQTPSQAEASVEAEDRQEDDAADLEANVDPAPGAAADIDQPGLDAGGETPGDSGGIDLDALDLDNLPSQLQETDTAPPVENSAGADQTPQAPLLSVQVESTTDERDT
ncbi:MAG: transcription antitermination factor NusB [Actinomycetaceae bacterium]|nr:transcription antitermination factor NusB [Actinomycetaceae bacterium]